MKQFGELTKEELKQLRDEIVLNSVYFTDYKNSFGFSCYDMCDFFDGYYDYIWELACDDYGDFGVNTFNVLGYDTIDNLWDWFSSYEDFSWVRMDKDVDGYHGEPYVNVTVKYKDDGHEIETFIALDEDVDEDVDDKIFFYCDGMNGLKSLMTEDNGEDFVVESVNGFSFELF